MFKKEARKRKKGAFEVNERYRRWKNLNYWQCDQFTQNFATFANLKDWGFIEVLFCKPR